MDNCQQNDTLTTYTCPFGIHGIANEGKEHNIKAGQWYGP